MVRQPQAFLMDEPLSNLDAALRISTRAEIKQLHQAMQTTFVYVTHDQAEALTLADRIVVMREGVVQQIGTPDEIYEAPRNTFVAAFLGNPPINFLEGTVSTGDAGAVFTRGDIALALPEVFLPALREQGRREVVLGLRAEDVLEEAGSDARRLNGRVSSVLPVGSDQFLGVETSGGLVFLRVGKDRRHREGDTVAVPVNTGRLHLFDKASGVSLRDGPVPAA
jgi:multiple sugar transport system ATP-binding protein